MLVSFGENIIVHYQLFSTRGDPEHTWYTSLEQPDKLIEIMEGNLPGLSQHRYSFQVLIEKSIDGVAVFAGAHREVWVVVGEDAVVLCQLVDDNEGGAAGHRSGHTQGAAQQYHKS
jgi:hypothetical protein